MTISIKSFFDLNHRYGKDVIVTDDGGHSPGVVDRGDKFWVVEKGVMQRPTLSYEEVIRRHEENIEESRKPRYTYYGSCFIAGTEIATPDGPRAIEAIRTGDRVLTYDAEIGDVVLGTVSDTSCTRNYRVGSLELADGVLIGSTPDHPIFTVRDELVRPRESSVEDARTYAQQLSGMRVPGPRGTGLTLEVRLAGDLVAGDRVVVFARSELHESRVVAGEFRDSRDTVYNFTVDRTHTYFANGLLVHNR